jgi:hypothetical protein
MKSALPRLFPATVLALLAVCASQTASTHDTVAMPSVAELRDVEAKIAMPRGTELLAKYFRFYYAQADSPGWIYGMYVAKHYFGPAERPGQEIVVVASEADIPAPYDAGCDVVFVSYDVQNDKLGAIYCAPELSL